jgi:polar amino acid transport system substrate-binding protein
MTRRVIVTLAALVFAAAILAACDSGSKSSDESQSTPTTEAPATPTTPPPTCGDPRASFAPDGPRPAPGQMPENTFMKTIQDRGRLIVGVSADNYLFGYQNPETGQLEGFDIDVAKRIAREIFGTDVGKIEYRVMTFAQRIPALNAKAEKDRVDMVADIMTINCTRWNQISFSSQYYDAGQRMLVRRDSRVKTVNDLNGQRVCVADGSTSLDNMKRYPKVKLVTVDDVSDCMVLFQQGTVDALVSDDTVLVGFAKQDPYARVVTEGDPLSSEPYGLGVNKEHPEFVRFINSVLEDARRDGSWRQWYADNLGNPVKNPPPAMYGRQS